MQKTLLIALISFALGVFSVQLFSIQATPDERKDAADTDIVPADEQSLSDLAQALAREKKARLEMEQRLETLSARVNELSLVLADNPATEQKSAITNKATSTVPAQTASKPSAAVVTENTTGSEKAPESFETLLAAGGFNAERIAAIRTLEDQAQMGELYLRDRANREGWIGTERYEEELRKLQQIEPLRANMSEDEYDRYLFALGRYNRVAIARVMADSPAAKAGLKQGDVILAYDNKRIFNWNELHNATGGGDAGESVTVEVQRDGKTSTVYLPRGPIGIHMESLQVDPAQR